MVPVDRFRAKFGDLSGIGIASRIGELAELFLADKKPEYSHEKGS